MKLFLWEHSKRPCSLDTASRMGWDSAERGYELLDTLEVGGTILDEDGDTWERVE